MAGIEIALDRIRRSIDDAFPDFVRRGEQWTRSVGELVVERIELERFAFLEGSGLELLRLTEPASRPGVAAHEVEWELRAAGEDRDVARVAVRIIDEIRRRRVVRGRR